MKISPDDVKFLDRLADQPELQQRYEESIRKYAIFNEKSGRKLLLVSPVTLTIETRSVNFKTKTIASHLYLETKTINDETSTRIFYPLIIEDVEKSWPLSKGIKTKITSKFIEFSDGDHAATLSPFDPKVAEEVFGTGDIAKLVNHQITGEKEY